MFCLLHFIPMNFLISCLHHDHYVSAPFSFLSVIFQVLVSSVIVSHAYNITCTHILPSRAAPNLVFLVISCTPSQHFLCLSFLLKDFMANIFFYFSLSAFQNLCKGLILPLYCLAKRSLLPSVPLVYCNARAKSARPACSNRYNYYSSSRISFIILLCCSNEQSPNEIWFSLRSLETNE